MIRRRGGIENKYKYNGIELDTSLGLNEYEAALRDLDPQTGRWWQVDPETENQEMWSPYTSNNDNPILYKDPRGNEGEACCQWFSDIVTTVVATTSVAIDNTLGTDVTERIANSGAIPSSQTATWNNAVTTANQTSLVAGTATAVVGGGVATGGEGLTIATGGLSSEVTVPAVVVGLGTAAVGTWVAANASKNLNQGNGLIKNENASNTPTANDEPTLSQKKDAVKKAQEKVGGNLSRGKGKFGSPMRGDSKKGYRLDPAHPNKPAGDNESVPHVNWWDYTQGKRNGTNSGAIPILPPVQQ